MDGKGRRKAPFSLRCRRARDGDGRPAVPLQLDCCVLTGRRQSLLQPVDALQWRVCRHPSRMERARAAFDIGQEEERSDRTGAARWSAMRLVFPAHANKVVRHLSADKDGKWMGRW